MSDHPYYQKTGYGNTTDDIIYGQFSRDVEPSEDPCREIRARLWELVEKLSYLAKMTDSEAMKILLRMIEVEIEEIAFCGVSVNERDG